MWASYFSRNYFIWICSRKIHNLFKRFYCGVFLVPVEAIGIDKTDNKSTVESPFRSILVKIYTWYEVITGKTAICNLRQQRRDIIYLFIFIFCIASDTNCEHANAISWFLFRFVLCSLRHFVHFCICVSVVCGRPGPMYMYIVISDLRCRWLLQRMYVASANTLESKWSWCAKCCIQVCSRYSRSNQSVWNMNSNWVLMVKPKPEQTYTLPSDTNWISPSIRIRDAQMNMNLERDTMHDWRNSQTADTRTHDPITFTCVKLDMYVWVCSCVSGKILHIFHVCRLSVYHRLEHETPATKDRAKIQFNCQTISIPLFSSDFRRLPVHPFAPQIRLIFS